MTDYRDTWLISFADQIEPLFTTLGSVQLKGYSPTINADVILTAQSVQIGDTDRYWVVCGTVPQSTVDAPARSMVLLIIIVGAALVVGVAITVFTIIRRALSELPVLMHAADSLSEGDTANIALGEVATGATQNEIQLLKQSFQKMIGTIVEQAESVKQIASGDLSAEVTPKSDRDVLNVALAQLLESNNRVFHEIQTAATQVSNVSQQLASGSQELAQSSVEQTASVQTLTDTISSVAGTARDNEELAGSAASLSGKISQNAQEGSDKMQLMTQAVNEINEASQSIGKVIKVIDDIAFQTNILALNAAVEAARAGEHGKGFAVVADEVRNLAGKSAEAAKETSVLIENSIEKAEEGSSMAGSTAAMLDEIVAGIGQSTEIVGKIPEASAQQSDAIDQVNQGIEQVMQVVQQNSATAEEIAAASEEMSSQAALLQEMVSQFKLRE